MLTLNELKHYSSLLRKKNRILKQKFIVEGQRLVKEALKSQYECELLIINESYQNKHSSRKIKYPKNIRFEKISDKKFQKLCDTKSPPGIAAILSIPNKKIILEDRKGLIVALENISDPGNVGTIIRTCDWFGVKNILISKDSADIFNSKVIRSTMGSIFHVNIIETENFYSKLDELKKEGWKVFCSDMEGENIFKRKKEQRSILVLNSEAHGPSQKILDISNEIITIPKLGQAESLNVASAAAVIISQLTR